jgi:phenylpropionate dioxygenase-like ring-hydroxylating dioxygenase large terminal subunit
MSDSEAHSHGGPQGGSRLIALNPKAWYVVARSGEVSAKRLVRRKALGQPLVLFRDAVGQAVVWLDQCPHRNVPLSAGRLVGGQVECGYHGWRFDASGSCVRVPGLPEGEEAPSRCVTRFSVREQQGFVWIWPDLTMEPEGEPFHFEYADRDDYLTVRKSLETPGTVRMVAENALDVPHTAFLHAGLFRKDRARRLIQCEVRVWQDRVECHYRGEPRPSGVAGWLLSPSGGQVEHVDRFLLPSVVQVEYKIGTESHLILNGALTPIDEESTVMHACVSVRSRLPMGLLRWVIEPVAVKIFQQDVRVLTTQMAAAKRLGGTQYDSTSIDVLGPQVQRILRRALRGSVSEDGSPPKVRNVEMWV